MGQEIWIGHVGHGSVPVTHEPLIDIKSINFQEQFHIEASTVTVQTCQALSYHLVMSCAGDAACCVECSLLCCGPVT